MDGLVRALLERQPDVEPEALLPPGATLRRTHDPLRALTTREREVLTLVAEGRSNDAVAEHLLVNLRTVETHMANILTKLGLPAEPGTHRRVLAVLTFLRMQASETRRGDVAS